MNRRRHKRHWKNSAAFIGHPFIVLCSDRVLAKPKEGGYHPGFFCRFAGAQKPCCRPQGKGTVSFFSAWGTKIFSGRRAPSRDGNQAGKRTTAYPARRTKPRRTHRMEPTDPVTAEQIYERRWASTVFERVLGLLKNEYVAAGNAALFNSLKQLLPDEPGAPLKRTSPGN